MIKSLFFALASMMFFSATVDAQNPGYNLSCSQVSISSGSSVEVTGNIKNPRANVWDVNVANLNSSSNICCSQDPSVSCSAGNHFGAVVAPSASAPYNSLSWIINIIQPWYCVSGSASGATNAEICLTSGLDINTPNMVINNQIITPAIVSASTLSAVSISASGVPGFNGDGSGLTNVIPNGSSVTFVNTTTGTVQMSSYTFTAANSWVFLATATVSGTRSGENLFTSASISFGSSGTSTSFCCGVWINGVFPSGESYRCQNFSNIQSAMTLDPFLFGVGSAGSTKVALVCSVSQVAVGVQQAWSVRVSGLGI